LIVSGLTLASKMLGWEEIDAFVVECSEDDAKAQRMIEITENLHRAELTAGERARLIAEWTELTGVEVSQSETPLPGGKQPREQGIRKTAKELGLDKEDVRRCMKIASLSPEAQAVAVEEGLDWSDPAGGRPLIFAGEVGRRVGKLSMQKKQAARFST
jgi:ParB-like chromosome segregation protein Spo0J